MDTIIKIAFVLNIVFVFGGIAKPIWDNHVKKRKGLPERSPCEFLKPDPNPVVQRNSCVHPFFQRQYNKKGQCTREKCLGFCPTDGNGEVLYEPIWKVILASVLQQFPALATALLLFLKLKGD